MASKSRIIISCMMVVMLSQNHVIQVVQSFVTPSSFTMTKPYKLVPHIPVKHHPSSTHLFMSSSSWSSLSKNSKSRNNSKFSQGSSTNNLIHKDIVIIGGGLAGLSTAFYLSLNNSNNNNNNNNRQITILEKEDLQSQKIKTSIGSFAAAGMLAPQSERLPSGPLLDICLESRDMYTDFVRLVEGVAKNCGPYAKQFLWDDCHTSNNNNNGSVDDKSKLQPWEVGYSSTGGFLAPAFAGDSVATWSPPPQIQGSAKWLDDVQIHEMEPSLHPDVIGGWWFPEDASVDARRLTCSLRAACMERGVQFLYGDGCAAGALELSNGTCHGIRLNDGRIISANSIVIANGSWMRDLLPVPVTPHKGQSFSVRMPSNQPPVLNRVLFAQDTYIVPKADGRIIVGATVEVGTFDPSVTPFGMMHCMSNAMALLPGLADLPMEESWAGLRPTTPDKAPILGRTSWDNVFLAGGYWRNGVLLAPKTGQLIGDLVLNNGGKLENEQDELFLQSFSWDRFTVLGGGKRLAANTRYAASMHPVHKRSSGLGVAAAVGTELGFYSGAASASQERKRDRDSLFGEADNFEKAAMLGKSDALSFVIGEKDDFKTSEQQPTPFSSNSTNNHDDDDDIDDLSSRTQPFDGTPDALTVSHSDDENVTSSETNSISSMYEKIRENKSKSNINLEMNEKVDENQDVDPGFRIYHVDSQTREVREVPPFTSPKEFEDMIANNINQDETIDDSNITTEENQMEDETTYDGYQVIQKLNSSVSRNDELDKMKAARIANRIKVSEIDPNKIGVMKASSDDKVLSQDVTKSNTQIEHTTTTSDSETNSYDETTYDGYQTIQKLNSSITRKEELDKMKAARIANRIKVSEIDPNKIGVFQKGENDAVVVEPANTVSDVTTLYSTIKENKKKVIEAGIEMNKYSDGEDKADPGFRIYRVDSETGEAREVPPYTSPQEMEELIAAEKNVNTDNKLWGE